MNTRSAMVSGTLLLLGFTVCSCCKEKDSQRGPGAVAEPAAQPATAETAKPSPTPVPVDDTKEVAGGYQRNGFPAAMPKTSTPVPTATEWRDAPGITTKKFPDGCQMKFVREWLKINCSKDTNTATPLRVTGITGMGGRGADYFVFEKEGKVLDIIVRTKDGKKGTANFVTSSGTYLVGYDWPYRAPFPSTVFQ